MTPQPPGPQKGTLDKAEVTSDQLTAASVGNVDWLRLCMQKADSHVEQDGNGFTALHMAALHGRLQCLKLLIEDYKIDVNLPSRCKWRALHLVLNQKNGKRAKECLQLLLQCGADVNTYLHNAMWNKDKEERAQELKKMEKLKRNILEMDQEALLKMAKSHVIPQQTCFCNGTETQKPPEKSIGISIKSGVLPQSKLDRMSCKLLPGKEQHKKKSCISKSLDKDTKKKRTKAMSIYDEEEGTKKGEGGGEHYGVKSICQCCQWNPSYNPTMPPVTDIYRTPTLRLGIDPEDVTGPDLSNVITLDKDEHGQPQIKTIQGQVFPSQLNLPYETIQRCLFPKTCPKERISTPNAFKANHVFDVPKKQQPREGRKPVSEISFHLRQSLDSRLRKANKPIYC